MGTKAESEANNSGGTGMVVALPHNSINSLSSSEVNYNRCKTSTMGI